MSGRARGAQLILCWSAWAKESLGEAAATKGGGEWALTGGEVACVAGPRAQAAAAALRPKGGAASV